MFNRIFETDNPYKAGGPWGPFGDVRYTGMGRLGSVDVGGGLMCSAPTASLDAMGNALDANGNRITCDVSNIGVNCVDGVCTDLDSGMVFDDPTPMIVGATALALVVGVVNPLTAMMAGAATWILTGGMQRNKPGTGFSQH